MVCNATIAYSHDIALGWLQSALPTLAIGCSLGQLIAKADINF
jgi:hypothetical protein